MSGHACSCEADPDLGRGSRVWEARSGKLETSWVENQMGNCIMGTIQGTWSDPWQGV